MSWKRRCFSWQCVSALLLLLLPGRISTALLSGAVSPRRLAEDTQQAPSLSHIILTPGQPVAALTAIAERHAKQQQLPLFESLVRLDPGSNLDLTAQKRLRYPNWFSLSCSCEPHGQMGVLAAAGQGSPYSVLHKTVSFADKSLKPLFVETFPRLRSPGHPGERQPGKDLSGGALSDVDTVRNAGSGKGDHSIQTPQHRHLGISGGKRGWEGIHFNGRKRSEDPLLFNKKSKEENFSSDKRGWEGINFYGKRGWEGINFNGKRGEIPVLGAPQDSKRGWEGIYGGKKRSAIGDEGHVLETNEGYSATKKGWEGVLSGKRGWEGVLSGKRSWEGVLSGKRGWEGVLSGKRGWEGVLSSKRGWEGVLSGKRGWEGIVSGKRGWEGLIGKRGWEGLVGKKREWEGIGGKRGWEGVGKRGWEGVGKRGWEGIGKRGWEGVGRRGWEGVGKRGWEGIGKRGWEGLFSGKQDLQNNCSCCQGDRLRSCCSSCNQTSNHEQKTASKEDFIRDIVCVCCDRVQVLTCCEVCQAMSGRSSQ